MSKIENFLKNIWEVIKLFARIVINIKHILLDRYHEKVFLNKKVLLIANGPSLNKIDINKVIDDDTVIICVNYFPCMDERFFELKPEYLCILDPDVLGETENLYIDSLNKELNDTLQRVDWNLKIIKLWSRNIEINNNKISYINLSNIVYHCKFLRHFFYSRNIATAGIQNVAIGALFFAVISSADMVYLAGVDNSDFKGYEINEKNEVYLTAQHHYGMKKIRKVEIAQGRFADYFRLYSKMFEQYQYLGEYIQTATNAKVINLNPYSLVDVFDKTMDYWKNEG